MKSPLKFLSKDEILKVDDLVTDIVEVPEWGDGAAVKVRGLTGVERDEWENSRIDRKAKRKKGEAESLNLTNFRASLVVRTVVNDAGERLFTDKDAVLIGRKSAKATGRIFDKAMSLSGITDEDVEEMTEDLDEEGSAEQS